MLNSVALENLLFSGSPMLLPNDHIVKIKCCYENIAITFTSKMAQSIDISLFLRQNEQN
jgi:hypothetical protein